MRGSTQTTRPKPAADTGSGASQFTTSAPLALRTPQEIAVPSASEAADKAVTEPAGPDEVNAVSPEAALTRGSRNRNGSGSAPALAPLDNNSPVIGHSLSRFSILPGGPVPSAVSPLRPQAKMSVSQPGEPAEVEAESTAEQVMRMPAPASVPIAARVPLFSPSAASSVSRAAATPAVSRAAATPAEQMGVEGDVDRDGADAAPAVNNALSGSGGQALDGGAQQFLGERMGQNFSQVRIHADESAARSADAVNAQAYTVGNNVVFGRGQYQPGTSAGKKLLAHELTHVVQQTGGAARQVKPQPMQRAADSHDAGTDTPDVSATDRQAISRVPQGKSLSRQTQTDTQQPGHRRRGQATHKTARPGYVQTHEDWRAGDTWETWSDRAIRNYVNTAFASLPEQTRLDLIGRMDRAGLVNEGPPPQRPIRQLALNIPESYFEAFRRATVAARSQESETQARGGNTEQDTRSAPTASETPVPAPAPTPTPSPDQTPGMGSASPERTDGVTGPMPAPVPAPAPGPVRNQLLSRFEDTAKQVTLELLQKSRERTLEERAKFQGTDKGSQDHRDETQQAARQLADLQSRIQAREAALMTDARKETRGSMRMFGGGGDGAGGRFAQYMAEENMAEAMVKRNPEIVQMKQQFEQVKQVYGMLYPVLLTPDLDYKKIAEAAPSGVQEQGKQRIEEILKGIADTEANIKSGSLSVWNLAPVVGLAKQRMGIAADSPDAATIDSEIKSRQNLAFGLNIALMVVGIGLGLVAIFATGGLATFALVGGAALGGVGAAQHYQEFSVDRAGHRSDLDPDQALVANDPSVAWLVADLVLAGLDVGGAALAVRNMSRTLRTINELSALAPALRSQRAGDVAAALQELENVARGEYRAAKAASKTAPGVNLTEEQFVNRVLERARRRLAAEPDVPTQSSPAATNTPGTGNAPPAPASQTAPSAIPNGGVTPSAPGTVSQSVPTQNAPSSAGQVPQNAGPASVVNPATVGAAAQERVRQPISGLYQSIDPSKPPAGWVFKNTVRVEGNGTQVIQTTVTSPNGETGFFERAFNSATGQFEMRNAFLEDLPKWINEGTPLVANRGTPTVAYLSMYQMRQLGVGFGQLKKVKMSTIQNVEAIFQLETLTKRGMSLDEAILKTHSVQYGETSLIQSGHQIVGAEVQGGRRTRIETMLSHYEQGNNVEAIARHKQLLQKYNLDRNDIMLWDYDIYLKVKPLPPGVDAPPLSGGLQP